MHRHNFFLPTELVETLRVLAEQRDITMSALIREILTAYVAEQRPTDE